MPKKGKLISCFQVGDRCAVRVTRRMTESADWDGLDFLRPGTYPALIEERAEECDREGSRAFDVKLLGKCYPGTSEAVGLCVLESELLSEAHAR